jgi:phage tail-like protein
VPEPGGRIDPIRNFNFLVEIDQIAQGSFMDCSAPEATTEVIEYREGGDRGVGKLPGRTTYGDITLKRGVTASLDLWSWRAEVVAGKTVPRRNGSIVVFDLDNNREVARWNFTGAWPSKWTGPALSATGNEVAVETLVLTVEELSRA